MRDTPSSVDLGSTGYLEADRVARHDVSVDQDLPLFIDKVRDVVGPYLNPPDAAVVLCVDERSEIQALHRTAPILRLIPGTPERRTHDYRRHGTEPKSSAAS